MQIISRNLPQLQNAVSSGLDSVTQGIVQHTSGLAAQDLTQIKDSFSAAGLDTTTLNPTSSIQPEAGFQSPGTYFNEASTSLPEKFTAMTAALNDQNLRPESTIGNFVGSLGNFNSKISSLPDSPGTDQGIIIIGGRFQTNPTAIKPTASAIVPNSMMPNLPIMGPNPPAIMPNEILHSQLQVLRDMETTVQQSANLYQQLNLSSQRRAWTGDVLKASDGAAKGSVEKAIQAEDATLDYAQEGAKPEAKQQGWGEDEYTRDQYEFFARLIFGMFKYPSANPLTGGLW
jgi:hypothetical protein